MTASDGKTADVLQTIWLFNQNKGNPRLLLPDLLEIERIQNSTTVLFQLECVRWSGGALTPLPFVIRDTLRELVTTHSVQTSNTNPMLTFQHKICVRMCATEWKRGFRWFCYCVWKWFSGSRECAGSVRCTFTYLSTKRNNNNTQKKRENMSMLLLLLVDCRCFKYTWNWHA